MIDEKQLAEADRNHAALAKALHDLGTPSLDMERGYPYMTTSDGPLCLDESCQCGEGLCFCPAGPGCLDVDDNGDGKHFSLCIEARKALIAYVESSKKATKGRK